MGLFKAIVGVTIETVLLPLDITLDVVTMGARKAVEGEAFTERRLEKIKEEAAKADDGEGE